MEKSAKTDQKYKEIAARAVRLLAAREHSCMEMRRKLVNKGYADDELLEQVIEDLKQRNYLNDDRFTQSYIEYRKGRGFGPVRIHRELHDKGIVDSLIHRWLDQNSSDWKVRLHQVADKKYGSQPAEGRKEQARRARFLESRGFPGYLIGDFLWG